jgi:hypothetical protein
MKVKFLVEMKVEEIIDISPEEFLEIENMNDEDKENFFWDKARNYESITTNIDYKKIKKRGKVYEYK